MQLATVLQYVSCRRTRTVGTHVKNSCKGAVLPTAVHRSTCWPLVAVSLSGRLYWAHTEFEIVRYYTEILTASETVDVA
jgi:hypothetical protein